MTIQNAIQKSTSLLGQFFGLTVLVLAFWIYPNNAMSQGPGAAGTERVIYSVYNHLHMGEPGEKSMRDFYVNMGSQQGVQVGTRLKVTRRVATFDVISKRLFKDMEVPLGFLKVIHVEDGSAIARLEDMVAPEKRPAVSPNAIVVGDLVYPMQN